jgi:hypothetical protein
MVNVDIQLYRPINTCQYKNAQGILWQSLQFRYVGETTYICMAPRSAEVYLFTLTILILKHMRTKQTKHTTTFHIVSQTTT